ncbi:hydrogenase maturation protease [Nocardia sp. NPDC003963]
MGVGTGCRRDDGVGPLVVSRLAALDMPGLVLTVSDGDCAQLLELWTGMDLAIVVDAMRATPARPGRIRRIDGSRLRSSATAASSHSLGVAEAVRLGHALDRLPRRLVVVTVEAARLDPGIGLTAAVAAAVPKVIEIVRTELKSSAAAWVVRPEHLPPGDPPMRGRLS